MKFNGEQMMAIMSVAHVMVLADGQVENEELDVVITHLKRFGVPIEDWKLLIQAGDTMEPTHALAVIAAMDSEQKEYVTSLLGAIIIADEDIDDKEVSLWRLITKICKLPTMSISEAVENLKR